MLSTFQSIGDGLNRCRRLFRLGSFGLIKFPILLLQRSPPHSVMAKPFPCRAAKPRKTTMGKRNKAPQNASNSSASSVPQEQICYEGERLARLLKLILSGIESAKVSDRNSLPEKFWYKQQFAIGVNEVTRLLEWMAPTPVTGSSPQRPPKAPSVKLQVILVASDCNPKWLTKHLPSLASSRKVPMIFVRDQKMGSLRLGELVKLKTAIAIGIKAKGSSLNQVVREVLQGCEVEPEMECSKTTEMPSALSQ